jgi:hypothetical protein
MSLAYGGHQVPQLLVNVGRVGNGLGDLGPQNRATTLAEAMDGHLDGAFRRAQIARRLLVGSALPAAKKLQERVDKLVAQIEGRSFRKSDAPALPALDPLLEEAEA